MTNLGPYFTLIMNYGLDKAVDRFINDLLDTNPVVVKVDEYCATFEVDGKRIRIWTDGKWFAYASRAGDDSTNGFDKYWKDKRPKRKTMVRLNRYVKEHTDAVVAPSLTLSKVLKGEM